MDTADTSARTPVVDVHAHVLLPEVEALVRDRPERLAHERREVGFLGTESAQENQAMMRGRLPRLIDLGERLRGMDRAGIDAQVVSVTPSQYHPWADAGQAREVSQAVHEGVAALCVQAPDRLTGLGVLPLQHPDLAVEALEDAVAHGLLGVEVSTYAPAGPAGTVELSDRRLDPFWSRATELGALVFVHPFGCTVGSRLDRWYLANTVGQPMEHAIALSQVIFAGVLDRNPGLRLLAAHGGGYLPGYLGRSDHAWRARTDAHSCDRPPSSYLVDLLVDSLVLDPAELALLVARMGAGNVLLGSDSPFDMGEDLPLDTVRAAGLSPADQEAIGGGNAIRLGLAPAAVALVPGA